MSNKGIKGRNAMNYEESLEYIHSIMWQQCAPGLGRIRKLMDLMGNPQDSLKYIHIAGTNGKGSSAAMLSSILTAAGYRTGLFTSPHICRFNERMKINGEDITDEELSEIATYVQPFTDKMGEPVTEFELISAIGFEYFRRNQCDIVVMEVGLGGSLDCTNIIRTPEVAVITAIGLDHTGILGDTLEEIAREKAGIIKEKGQVVAYGQEPQVEAVFRKKARQEGCEIVFSDGAAAKLQRLDLDGQLFDCRERKGLRIPLVGTYQLSNASLVLTVVDVLNQAGWNIMDQAVAEGLLRTKWPSRFEVMRKRPVFIVDGAHNPQGIRATARSLEEHFGGKKILFVLGVMSDKDLGEMIPCIAPLADRFIAVRHTGDDRAMEPECLARYLRQYTDRVVPCQTVEEGVSLALREAGEEDVICALGSLYLSGEVRSLLNSGSVAT